MIGRFLLLAFVLALFVLTQTGCVTFFSSVMDAKYEKTAGVLGCICDAAIIAAAYSSKGIGGGFAGIAFGIIDAVLYMALRHDLSSGNSQEAMFEERDPMLGIANKQEEPIADFFDKGR